MLLLYPDGHGETVVIGPDVFAGQHPQFTVPQGVWQGSAPVGGGAAGYSFVGNQLGPAFGYDDFEIGYRDELQKQISGVRDARIGQLTREEFKARPAVKDPRVHARRTLRRVAHRVPPACPTGGTRCVFQHLASPSAGRVVPKRLERKKRVRYTSNAVVRAWIRSLKIEHHREIDPPAVASRTDPPMRVAAGPSPAPVPSGQTSTAAGSSPTSSAMVPCSESRSSEIQYIAFCSSPEPRARVSRVADPPSRGKGRRAHTVQPAPRKQYTRDRGPHGGSNRRR